MSPVGPARAAFLALALIANGGRALAEEERRGEAGGGEGSARDRLRAGARNLGSDALYLVTFPTRATRRGVGATAAAGAGIVALVFLDERIRDEIRERRSPSLDRWERRVEPMGSIKDVALASLAVYGAGLAADSPRAAETGRALIESLAFTTGCDMTAKAIFGRAPPGGSNRARDFFHGGSYFPSGHAATAFAWATVLAERHGRAAAWIAYPLAAAVGLSRVERDVHWTSDVVAGALLGHVVSKAVVHRRNERLRGTIAVVPAREGFAVVFSAARS